MKKLKFSDLSYNQRKKICNGCGAKGGWLKVPDFIFTACCDHHDFKYWRGCGPAIFSSEFWKHPIQNYLDKWKDRKVADLQFFKHMLIDAENYPIVNKRYKYMLIASLYYNAVRKFGWLRYNWFRKEKTKDNIK